VGVLIKTVLCDLDGVAKEKSTVASKNADENSENREINMVVQTPFAQSTYNLLRGFCSHNDSIANNPSDGTIVNYTP
jgi:hypothetical protein